MASWIVAAGRSGSARYCHRRTGRKVEQVQRETSSHRVHQQRGGRRQTHIGRGTDNRSCWYRHVLRVSTPIPIHRTHEGDDPVADRQSVVDVRTGLVDYSSRVQSRDERPLPVTHQPRIAATGSKGHIGMVN